MVSPTAVAFTAYQHCRLTAPGENIRGFPALMVPLRLIIITVVKQQIPIYEEKNG